MKTFAKKKLGQTEQNSTSSSPSLALVDRQTRETMRALLNSGTIGAKLEVGAVGDPAEHDADRMAEAVVNGHGIRAAPRNARGPVGAKARSVETSSFLADAKGGAGRSFSVSEADYFESRFNSDFSHVRIHDSLEASHAASSINARAFAHGSDIYLKRGEYSFNSQGGKRLMAHELAHTLPGNCNGKICRSPEGMDNGDLKIKKRPKRFATDAEVEQFLTYLSTPDLIDMGIIEQSMFAQAFDLYCSYIEWAERGATAVEFALGESATGAALGTALGVVGALGIILMTRAMILDFCRASGTDEDILRVQAFVESLVNKANNKPFPDIHDYQLSFGDEEDKKKAWEEGIGWYQTFMAEKPEEGKMFLIYIAMSDPDWVCQELFDIVAKSVLDEKVYAIVVNKKLSEVALEAMSAYEQM